MKAVVLRAPGDVGVDDVAEPRILEDDDAIVAVRATAICGADLFPYHGLTPGFEDGTILGHEFAGEVVDAGPAARDLVGRRVVNASMISCGTCGSCRAARVTQCDGRALFGYSGVYPRLDGGQAELVRVPRANRALRLLPDEVSDEAAVFLADILPTGFAAVVRAGVSEGDSVAVVGCGPVGLMAVMCAVQVGAARVIAIDGIESRRQLAERLGAEAVDPAGSGAAVAEATDGLGADVVVEAAGVPAALDASLELARGRGTISVVGAHFEPDYPLDNARMFERELTLRFSIGDPTADGGHLLALVASRRLDPTPVVTHRLPLADAGEAYRLFDSREATKVVLAP